MRKINALLSAAIMLLFVIHAIIGTFQMTGIYSGGGIFSSAVSYGLIIFTLLHALIGVILTAKTVISAKKSGVFYIRENKKFLAVRLSGLTLMMLIFCHMMEFMGYVNSSGAFRLFVFDEAALAVNILLVISMLIHIILNVNPLLIALGAKRLKPYAPDILFVISAVCFFGALGFVIYYVRWLF